LANLRRSTWADLRRTTSLRNSAVPHFDGFTALNLDGFAPHNIFTELRRTVRGLAALYWRFYLRRSFDGICGAQHLAEFCQTAFTELRRTIGGFCGAFWTEFAALNKF